MAPQAFLDEHCPAEVAGCMADADCAELMEKIVLHGNEIEHVKKNKDTKESIVKLSACYEKNVHNLYLAHRQRQFSEHEL